MHMRRKFSIFHVRRTSRRQIKMKIVALISGGKDSCFNMMQCVAEGHDIVALANLKPKDKDELDSYMYQSVGHHAIDLYAEAMDLPLYRREISGSSRSTGKDYTPVQDDEVEDLYELLKNVKEEREVAGVAVGAILSNYQRVRVENVCQRLQLTPLAYLWRRDQEELLEEMIQCHVHAVLIKVAAMGLKPNLHLGKSLSEMQDHLLKKNAEFELNVCGEGGEFETFTLDCPLFRKAIVLDEVETVIHSDDAFAPVGYLNIKQAHLEDKQLPDISRYDLVKDLPMKRSTQLMGELFSDMTEMRCTECEKLQTDYTYTIPDTLKPKLVVKKDTTSENGHHLWITNLLTYNNQGPDVKSRVNHLKDQLQEMLTSCGNNWTMSNIVLVHFYVRNMAEYAEINSVYITMFGINPPARVCVQATLPENVLLMFDCYAYSNHDNRDTMHVQGLSHWAPANIGPYSQCVKIADSLYVAGQIGMIPANLAVIGDGIQAEAHLSLLHVQSILVAMSPGCSLANVTSCVCYVTHPQFISVANEEWKGMSKDELCTPVFVVVSDLPKGALIEWQVVARTPRFMRCIVYREVMKDKDLQCSAYLRHNTGKLDTEDEEYSYPSITASVYAEDIANMCTIEPDSAVNLLHRCYTEARNNIEEDNNKRPCVQFSQIFYPAHVFKYEQLLQAVEQVFEGEPIAVVPVTVLEKESMVLAMCQ